MVVPFGGRMCPLLLGFGVGWSWREWRWEVPLGSMVWWTQYRGVVWIGVSDAPSDGRDGSC